MGGRALRILGIDPGSRATGYGIVRRDGSRFSRVDGGVIRPNGATVAERLSQILAGLRVVVEAQRPDAAALESVFTAKNPRSALLLGEARGVALAVCGAAGLETAEYAPTEVKLAVVGYGRADKSQVQQMVQRLLGLAGPPPQDEADALAVAICHCARRRPDMRRHSLEERARRAEQGS